MNIHDIILERVSSVLYHATSFPAANKMLETNTMRGSEISFARSLQGAYHTSNKLIGVIFEFDGDKLNHNYKGGPVGTENFSYDEEWYDPDDPDTWEFTGRENGQLEDRIYSKNGIDDVRRYIVRAIIYAPIEYIQDSSEDEFDGSYNKQMRSVVETVKRLEINEIPYRYVASEKGLVGKKDDKEGFVKVIKQMYQDDYSGNNVTQDTKDAYGVGNNWILHFSDYSNFDEDDFDSIVEIKKTFKGTRDDAVAAARKHADSNPELELSGITDVDKDEFTDL